MEIKKIIPQKVVDELEDLPEEKVVQILEKQPHRIAEIKSEKRTVRMCEAVVKYAGQGKLFRYIPKNMWDEHLYFLLAVYNAPYISCHIPTNVKNEDFFKKIFDFKIKNNIFFVSFFSDGSLYFKDSTLYDEAPKTLLTRELYLKTVRCNGALLGIVPKKFKDYKICETALNNTITAIQFLPHKFFDKEFVDRLISYNGLLLKYVPVDKITVNLCCKALQNNILAQKYIPDSLKMHKKILEQLDVLEQIASPQIALLQDNTFYNRSIAYYRNFLTTSQTDGVHSIENMMLSSKKRSVTIGKKGDRQFRIYYITDLHLNHKLLEKFPNAVNKSEIVAYIRELIIQMLSGINIYHKDYLLIGGDVSFCLEISDIFYRTLIEFINPKQIIVVLGNHELWDFNRFGRKEDHKKQIESIVDAYRKMFKSLGINFLHNDLLIANFDINECFEQRKDPITIISREKLLKMENTLICEMCQKSAFIVLGGLGFSGYNEKYNAETGLYRQVIQNNEEDLKQTQDFEELYVKLSQILTNKNLIIFSHTPKENWTKQPYIKNWVYISGHTHNNLYICNSKQKSYQDNQMGYHWKNLKLKYIILGGYYNIFESILDGIYEISRQQYIDFNYGLGIHCELNRLEGKLLMCKNNKYYMFFIQKQKSNKLYLLDGGIIKKLEINNIEYYYNNMVPFCSLIKKGTSKYFKALEILSKNIQAFGGDGDIHGSIVDIDFFNHVYLNPNDGTLHAYYSPYFGVQIKYTGIVELLKEQCPELYENYKKIAKNQKTLVLTKETLNGASISTDTQHYRESDTIKKMQYITKDNIIRLWNDSILPINNLGMLKQ